MLVTSDPANPNAFNAYRELARFAQQKENLSAAARRGLKYYFENSENKKTVFCPFFIISFKPEKTSDKRRSSVP